ncbi:hypothetical protein H257_17866 [Aphanomyces astaci]|uniref:Uncharacterized protein n=1 Tax=Aphanomyces astaci TaxID=112090 RepID=W4FD46_APHAT|nr:hypothetical protein H257_17866 [Aphanomyces astaci]ETV65405.1 hypothetical protein H257_17866 [Aphanomyces astaci]|eukprot:XP_009845120.1 hypothetical protein H257_17866 [Aphanomyces astaci]
MWQYFILNFEESEQNISLANNVRYSLPFPLVSAFVEFVRHDLKKKSDRAKKWITEDRKVMPGALKAYDQQLQQRNLTDDEREAILREVLLRSNGSYMTRLPKGFSRSWRTSTKPSFDWS